MHLINLKNIFLVSVTLLFYSCANKGIITDPPTGDDDLISFAYSSIKWPAGFYTEDLGVASIYYENTVSTLPINERVMRWIELSTDNIDTARQWSEKSSLYSAYYRELVSERETEKYFEFKRVYSANPRDVILFRVHKSTYLDRSMYDSFHPTSVIGVFKKIDFNKNDVKELIEYMWFVSHYNTGGKVYSTELNEDKQSYIYVFYEVSLMHGDWGINDTVQYIKNTFTVAKGNGEITKTTELLKQIEVPDRH